MRYGKSMSNDEYMSPADIDAEHCEQEHSYRRDVDCRNCDQRAELVHCAQCGASFEDNRWFTEVGSTTPNGCDHEALTDDWDREITCQVQVRVGVLADPRRPAGRCGDAVTTPGRTACAFHQRILDAEECSRIYQRLVARAS